MIATGTDTGFTLTYRVERVPGLTFGLTADGRAALMAGGEQIWITDPGQQASVQLVLEQLRVDQARVYGELHPPEPGSRGWVMAELKKLGVRYNTANRAVNRAPRTGHQSWELDDGRMITVTCTEETYGLQVEGWTG